jgi:hypothetical protein
MKKFVPPLLNRRPTPTTTSTDEPPSKKIKYEPPVGPERTYSNSSSTSTGARVKVERTNSGGFSNGGTINGSKLRSMAGSTMGTTTGNTAKKSGLLAPRKPLLAVKNPTSKATAAAAATQSSQSIGDGNDSYYSVLWYPPFLRPYLSIFLLPELTYDLQSPGVKRLKRNTKPSTATGFLLFPPAMAPSKTPPAKTSATP